MLYFTVILLGMALILMLFYIANEIIQGIIILLIAVIYLFTIYQVSKFSVKYER